MYDDKLTKKTDDGKIDAEAFCGVFFSQLFLVNPATRPGSRDRESEWCRGRENFREIFEDFDDDDEEKEEEDKLG